MSIHVTEAAAEWYKKELGISDGEAIRFFARYSSGGGLHPGFSLGIAVEKPEDPIERTEVSGITFYMEEQDHWYLKGHRLDVTYVEAEDDIIYRYETTE
ncbi:HesB/YadR/YfhF family protein [Paenibacillus sp. Marseille-Q4541]|uniref:HesB/YadR/YfhF family protein n=1 Tax=Paenibacillus sp. Marseille-Q4541 TaxID=2831522 RepID=UPI001BADDB9B|nr:HesB/YadR/YfhF family protein [Paenibacillus sp. Marseille-Q4541]